jgi:hypothetical protein
VTNHHLIARSSAKVTRGVFFRRIQRKALSFWVSK